MHNSEMRFIDLAEGAPMATLIFKGRRLCYANPASESITGYTRDELLSADFWHLVHPHCPENETCQGPLRPNGAAPEQRHEVPILTKAGDTKWLDFSAREIEYEGTTALLGTAVDITAWKLAREALEDAESDFLSLVENCPYPVAVHRDCRLLHANRTGLSYLGFGDTKDLADHVLLDLVHPEDREHARTSISVVEKTGAPSGLAEWRMTRPDGTVALTEIASMRMGYKGSTAVLSIAHDITGHRLMEEALRESEERYRALVELTPDAIIVETDGAIVFANNAAARIVGAGSPRELLGLEALSFVPVHQRRMAACRVQHAARACKTLPFSEVSVTRPDGSEAELEAAVVPFTYQGRPSLQIVARDVTARNKAEQALRKSETRNKAILDAMPDIVFRLDKTGVILDARSPHPEELFAQPHDFLGKSLLEVLPEPVALRNLESVRAALDTGRTQHVEYELPVCGEPRYYEARLVALSHDEVLGVVRNITAKKLAEQTIAEHQTHLLDTAKLSLLGLMAAGIAHDVLNPLTVVSGVASELVHTLKRGKLDSTTLDQLADQIHRSAERTLQLVTSLRNLSRNGGDDPCVDACLRGIIDDAVVLTQQRFRRLQTPLELPRVPEAMTIQCRPSQIIEVLLNLLANALDATQRFPDKWVKLSFTEDDQSIELAVTDSGHGIPPYDRGRLFDLFFTTKEKDKGTGLGLSISKQIIEAHNGRLWLDETSANTRFVVRLPKNQPTHNRSGAQQDHAPKTRHRAPGARQ